MIGIIEAVFVVLNLIGNGVVGNNVGLVVAIVVAVLHVIVLTLLFYGLYTERERFLIPHLLLQVFKKS